MTAGDLVPGVIYRAGQTSYARGADYGVSGEEPMRAALRKLDLGNPVAEFDDQLEKYFVENEAFRQLVNGKADIVAGDKGTGKTALYRILQKRIGTVAELAGVELLPGFNDSGKSLFQRLVPQTGGAALTERQHGSVWKTYIFSLVGNWLLDIVGHEGSENFRDLERTLAGAGLRAKGDKPDGILARILNAFWTPSSAEVTMTFSETGMPIVTPKIYFSGKKTDPGGVTEVRHEAALALLDACIAELGYTVWVALDRLDEAFVGAPEVEVPALRALLRTYLDLLEFKNLRLKIFVRRDLFARIVEGGFVNLSHVNAKKYEIVWQDDDLLSLLCRRVRDNAELVEEIGIGGLSDLDLFHRIFPHKVEPADRKPTSWRWLLARIQDGNFVKPPRNLIQFVTFAKDEQEKAEARSPRPFSSDEPLILADAMKRALRELSVTRVKDTLLAETSQQARDWIQQFKRAKAEQNRASLAELLKLDEAATATAIETLVGVGFLEPLRSSWKVPMLYRDGLEITQGKAFDAADQGDDED